MRVEIPRAHKEERQLEEFDTTGQIEGKLKATHKLQRKVDYMDDGARFRR